MYSTLLAVESFFPFQASLMNHRHLPSLPAPVFHCCHSLFSLLLSHAFPDPTERAYPSCVFHSSGDIVL